VDEAKRGGAGGRARDARGELFHAASGAALLAGLALVLVGMGEGRAQQSAPLRLKRTQEFAPFRFTGFEGSLVARYISDESTSSPGQAGGAAQRQRMSSQIEEVNIMTHSYIYHPTLLALDIGGGPLLDNTGYSTDGVLTRQGRQVYNLNARATVLREKPYTGAIFYDHRNQTQNIGPAQFMQTENKRYGLEFALLNPVIPTPLHLDVEHYETKGKGVDQVTDDRADRLRMRLDANIGTLGRTAFQYMNSRQASRSGSTGLSIQESTSDNGTMNLDTRLKFGETNQYDLSNVVTLNSHRYAFSQGPGLDMRDARFSLDLRARHSEDLQTYGRYDATQADQGGQSTSLNALNGGLSYRLNPAVSGSLAVRGESGKTGPAASTLYGIDGSAQYRRELAHGEARVGYTFGYIQREQEAAAQQARLLDERVTLSGTSIVPLSRPQVVAGSMAVSNLTRSQTYVEGVDYLVSAIGVITRIQRVIGGNILDGQDVLVDYSYEVGGSYALNQLDQTVNLSWQYKTYLNSYLRYSDSAPQLTSGTPTFQINPAKTATFGTRGEVPLRLPFDLLSDLRVGGYAERESRHEVISPYQRGNVEAYTQVALPWVRSGDLRLGTRRMQITYDNSPLGVNLKALDLRLAARLPYNIEVSLDASRERDTGASVPRERSFMLARAKWRKRKLQWSLDLNRTRDVQGAAERTRTYLQFTLRRDF
jgi:hypothetical protein